MTLAALTGYLAVPLFGADGAGPAITRSASSE